MPRCIPALFAILLLFVGGCQKLQVEKGFDLDASEFREVTIDAPSGEQKVQIKVVSTACPVSGFVVLEPKVAAFRKALADQLKPEGAIASVDRKKEFTMDATIPKKTSFTIFIADATKATHVEIKVSGG